MKLSFLPLLQVQRDLYALPRGMERFREYIKTMTNPETGDLALPLVAMNPMGKDHIPALIDEYISLGAETIAQEAIDGATQTIAVASHEFRVGVVVSDDLKGGWTNRWASEFAHRIESARSHQARVHHRHSVDERARVRSERARRGPDGDLPDGVSAAASARENRGGDAPTGRLRDGARRLHDAGAGGGRSRVYAQCDRRRISTRTIAPR